MIQIRYRQYDNLVPSERNNEKRTTGTKAKNLTKFSTRPTIGREAIIAVYMSKPTRRVGCRRSRLTGLPESCKYSSFALGAGFRIAFVLFWIESKQLSSARGLVAFYSGWQLTLSRALAHHGPDTRVVSKIMEDWGV